MPARIWIILLCFCSSYSLADTADSPQQMVTIGDLPLTAGETLYDCSLGYRTAGTLNADRSNVIVFTTWFTGTTNDLLTNEWIGPGRLADTDRYYVIAIDALGNGVSSSPSSSARQPGAAFPAIAIEDMVTAEHILLTRHLGIDHAHAVMGISMGGMQTFQWLGQYPDFMDKAVAIDGSPQLTSWDLLQWQTHADVIETLLSAQVEDAKITELVMSVFMLTLWTPDFFLERVPPETLPRFRADFIQRFQQTAPRDYLAQLHAMMALDATKGRSADRSSYPDRVKARLLVVASGSDHVVNPAPARALAETLGARYHETYSNCGHLGAVCTAPTVMATVNAFLIDAVARDDP